MRRRCSGGRLEPRRVHRRLLGARSGARAANGGELRIRAARLPARKTIDDATWFSRTLEGIGVVPLGKVFKWGDEVIDLIRGVENANDAGRAAEAGVDLAVHGDKFVEGATELVGLSDEGITTFDNAVTDAGDSATDQVDDVFERVDDSAISGPDQADAADGQGDEADQPDSDADGDGNPGNVDVDDVRGPRSELRQNMIAAGQVPQAGEQAHHIIPWGHPLAHQGRQHLYDLGIDVNSVDNGVNLPAYPSGPNPAGAQVHSSLNNPRYVRTVNEMILQADTPEEARALLAGIEAELQAGTFNFG